MSTGELMEQELEEYSSFNLFEISPKLVEITRRFRNLCAINTDQTDIFINRNTILKTFQIYKHYTFHKIETKVSCCDDYAIYPNSAELVQTQYQYMTISAQFLCNFVTSSYNNCVYIFSESFGESKFQDAVACAVLMKNRESLATILHIIHQCLNYHKHEDMALLQQFLTWRSLCCQILLDVVNVRLAMSDFSSSDTSTNAARADNVADSATEWLHLLIKLVIYAPIQDNQQCNDTSLKLFNLVGPSSAPTNNSCFNTNVSTLLTHEQVILLHVILAITEDSSDLLQTDDTELMIPCSGLLVRLLQLIESRLSDVLKQMTASDGARSPGAVTADAADMLDVLEFMMSLCAIHLGKLTGPIARHDRRVLQLRTFISTQTAIIPILIEYLTFVNHCKSADRANKVIGVSSDDGVLSLCNSSLQLLGNLVYGCTVAQDQLRLSGDQASSDAPSVGLLQILALCSTDISNPLRREFAILCLRNACEGNLRNQKCIESLVLQGVAEVDERLARAGMGVSFDPTSGKIVFKSTLPEATILNARSSSSSSLPAPAASATITDTSNDPLEFM